MTFGVVEETTIASTGDNRACSDERGGENECSGSKGTGGRTRCGGSSEKGSFCNGGRLRKKLLCLWRVRAHGLQLQKPGTKE